ncbi:NADP-dependent oxidoreductase [Rhodococcus zopfii]|uniref:NADP-dependent oxidoreductase n=1 Tax=Rhodococcus zopfii TaxID=43772 RepID=A0ABU3WQP7_9NOCA|nr:NADP-dependent oxidoreductase [Rhodococcus zopfii]
MIVGARGAATATMRAARHETWGSPLEVVEVPRPEPAAGEVRVTIAATGVNPIDIFTGRNAGYEQSMRLPFVPGWDVAGTVDALGYGVTRHRVGDRVFGLALFPHPAGTYAEFATVPAHQLVTVPSAMTFAEAGAAPMAALTAWQMLDAAGVVAGRRVLVDGASGGVGHLAVQLAAARGATVIALARPAHHDMLHALGAETCVDYEDPGAMTEIAPVDAFLDYVGHEFGRSLFGRVKPGGTAALATAWSIPSYPEDAARLGIHIRSCLVEPDPAALGEFGALVDRGAVRVVVAAEFDLDHAGDAQHAAVRRGGFGKTVIVSTRPEPA